MIDSELRALLRLANVPGIGPARVRNLVGHFQSAERVLKASPRELCRVNGIDHTIAENISRSDNEAAAQQQFDLACRRKIRILSFWDPDFPKLLKRTPDPPVLLFVQGKMEPQDENAIAIVGTRVPTQYGKMVAERLTGELVAKGLTIISGLARGIDTIAHRTAARQQGRTIGVLGSGLDIIYPADNRALAREMSARGAVISEYPFGTKPDAVNFPRRNRIISGLALGVIVVEAGVESGALITVNFALNQGREVFAVPGNIMSPQSAGPHRLIREGAKLVEHADDVLEELSSQLELFSQREHAAEIELDLDEDSKMIFALLSHEPLHIDLLKRRTELPAAKLMSVLLDLELNGIIKQLPGTYFVRNRS